LGFNYPICIKCQTEIFARNFFLNQIETIRIHLYQFDPNRVKMIKSEKKKNSTAPTAKIAKSKSWQI